jgi:multiple antibiotic resistance protein
MPRIPATRAFAIFSLITLASTALAQQVEEGATGQPQSIEFSLGKTFTFLFLTLGPLKLLAPFAKMTRALDGAARRALAFKSVLLAFLALIVASMMGENTLIRWNIAPGSLLMTAGVIFFLVALKPVLEQFATQPPPPSEGAPPPPPPRPFDLAFPTIVTPYGIAVLIVIMSLRGSEASALSVLGVALLILILDLIAMLFADRLLKVPLVAPLLGIVSVVMGVLQVALGVQAMVVALRLLGLHQ